MFYVLRLDKVYSFRRYVVMEGIIDADVMYREHSFLQCAGVSESTYKKWRKLGLRVRRTPSETPGKMAKTTTYIYGKDFIEFLLQFDM